MHSVAVAIINNMPFIQTAFFESVIPLLFEGSRTASLALMNVKAFPVDFARNWAMKQFMSAKRYKGVDWFLFLDIDQTFPRNTVKMLLDAADENRARVVSGVYFKRNFHSEVVGWKYNLANTVIEPVLDGTVQEVEIIGMGCALIHRSVIEEMGYPWFQYGPLHETVQSLATEDIWFCQRCKELNIPIYIHTGIICGHIMTIENTENRVLVTSLSDGVAAGEVKPV
jgi:hypothetical protein